MNRELRTALIGMTILALALGIGRFALTPLLPLMQADSGLGLVAGGWVASASMFGYLLGALLFVLWPLPQRASLRVGAVAMTLATIGMGLTARLDIWLAWRVVAGVASAALMVHGIAWSMARLHAVGRPILEHLVFSGVGIGILGGGLLVAGSRPLGASSAGLWIGFGVIAAALFAWMWKHLGKRDSACNSAASIDLMPPSGPAWTLIVMYGLLGFAYIIPASFLPLITERQLHLPELREWFWPLYGAATAASTLALRWLPASTNNRSVLAVCSISMLIGMLLCIVGHGVATFVAATLLLGGAGMPVVMYTMREARLLSPHNHVRLVAMLTVTFGVGQAAGPIFAAWLAARSGSFDQSLTVGAAICVMALVCTLVRRPRRTGVGLGAGPRTDKAGDCQPRSSTESIRSGLRST